MFVPPLKTSVNSPLLKAILNATCDTFGKPGTVKTFPGSTDAPNFNCSAVVFGAGSLKQCHSLSEYISLEDLNQAVKIYIKTIKWLQK